MFNFNRDKKRIELGAYMRRVADLTSPNLAPLTGDYWQVGIELTEVVKSGSVATALTPVVKRLLPRHARAEAALATWTPNAFDLDEIENNWAVLPSDRPCIPPCHPSWPRTLGFQ